MTTYGGTEEYFELLGHGREPRTFPSGEVIFRQGEPGVSMYLVRDGSVAMQAGDRVVSGSSCTRRRTSHSW